MGRKRVWTMRCGGQEAGVDDEMSVDASYESMSESMSSLSSDGEPPGLLQSSSDEERLSDDDMPGQTDPDDCDMPGLAHSSSDEESSDDLLSPSKEGSKSRVGRKAVAEQQQARNEPVTQDAAAVQQRDDGSAKDQGKGALWGEPECRPETARHSERCRKTGQYLATPGCQVTIDGLQNRPDLNGRTCLILDYIKDTGRLKARMLDGKILSLKPENVAFLHGPSEEREEDRRVAEEKRELEAATKSPKEKSEAYTIFMKQELQRLKIEDAQLSHKERFKRAANNWSKLTAEDKALLKQDEMTMRVAEEKRREEMRVAEEKRWADAEQKKREEKRKREEEERRRREEEQRRIEKERKRKEAQEEREFMATWGEAAELLKKMPTRTTVAGAGGGAGATSMASQSEGLLATLPKRRPWMEDMKETQYDFSRWQEEKVGEEEDYERVAEAQGDAVAGGDADDHSEPPSGVAPVLPGHLEKGAQGGGGERMERGEDPSGVLPASLSENLGMHDLGIWLTEDVKKWYAHADARLATSFTERLERLATRNFGRKVQKRLKGSTTVPIFEAYLDQTRAALRILWTEVVERGTSNIFVWFVSKHKHVSQRMLQIDESFKRLNRRRVDSDAPSVARTPDMQSEASGLKWEHAGDMPPAQGRELVRPDLSEALSRKTEFTKQEWAAFGIRDLHNDDWIKAGESYYKPLAERLVLARDQVLLSPDANTPLKIYELRSSRDLRRMQEEGWEPPLRLTSKEHAVVQERGTVLLLGRSGTGKTICIANKMAWDRQDCKAQGGLSQLFVARSGRICRMVGSLQGYSAGLAAEDGAGSSMALRELKKIEQQVMNALGVVSQPHLHVDYSRFKAEVFPAAVRGCKLDALVVWTAMRTFIKGSLEAVIKGQPVEEADFMGFGESRLRLTPDQRREAYHAYTSARAYYATHGLYDDCDKMLEIHNELKAGAELPADLRFYKVYVDEVQDLTNAELVLLRRMSESGTLFLAGDPAQSVVEGVDFRFKEVRRCFYELSGCLKTAVPAKPQTLHLNFRSHAGILELADQILQWLYDFFPGSCDKIDTDEGLCR